MHILANTSGPSQEKPEADVGNQYQTMKDKAALAKPKPHAKPPIDKRIVQFRCGHGRIAHDFAGRDCPACKNEKQQKQAVANRAARAKRWLKQDLRLPDGAEFRVSYDATAVRWTGTLTTPVTGPFVASATAVFKLLRELDRLYRQSVKPAATRDHSMSDNPKDPAPGSEP